MLSGRLGGLAGLSFIVLVGSVNIILGAAGMPQQGASPAEVQEFFTNHSETAALCSAIATLVWLCLAIFAAGLVARLRQAHPEEVESWPLLGMGAVIMQNAIFAGVVATQVVLANTSLSDDTSWAVWQLHNALFTLNGSALALILLSFSVAGLRSGLIRRWHARLGLLAAAVLALSSFTTPFHDDVAALTLIGLVGFVMWLIWVATYSVTLLLSTALTTSAQALAVGPAVDPAG
ncbi:MAG: hypothetical protein WBP61_00380 [Nocardioides sp.]